MSEHVVKGRVHSIGLADAFFTAEQLEEMGMVADSRLLIIEVDRDDPGDQPMGLVWAERVRITLAEDQP